MENIFLRWWGCGAFDVRMDDVNIAFDPYLFDENLSAARPDYDYIFISHEHFDHCSPRTLTRLCRGDRFKTLFVCPGCVYPNEPIDKNYGLAASDRDLPITKHIPEDKISILYPRYCDSRQRGRPWEGDFPDRSFPGPTSAAPGEIDVEVIESGENQRPDLPTNGYLVRHRRRDVSFLHIGDLRVPYPELKSLAGRVDFLIHMKVGLTPWDEADQSRYLDQLVDWIRPRFFIPIHYRTDRASDPIPKGTWPPDVTDVASFVESLREIIGDRTTVLPLTAGIEYEVEMPARRIIWKWQWRNSWSEPSWI
jgi:L-ascorbate metabolism protein UlaG (beta-lactamase superfamily)